MDKLLRELRAHDKEGAKRLEAGLDGVSRALVEASWTRPHNVCGSVGDVVRPQQDFAALRAQARELEPDRNRIRLEMEEKQQMEAQRAAYEKQVADEAAKLVASLECGTWTTTRNRLVTTLRDRGGWSSVLLGEVRDEGKPTEHIAFIAVSAGQEELVNTTIPKNSMKVWEVFSGFAGGEGGDEPVTEGPVTKSKVGEGTAIHISDVLQVPGVFFPHVQRPGEVFMVPVIYQSANDCAAAIEGCKGLKKAFEARKAFDQELKAKDAGKMPGKPKPPGEGENPADLEPEKFFELQEFLPAVDATRPVKWVLIADTIGRAFDDPSPEQPVPLASMEALADAAERLAASCRRISITELLRHRDYFYFHNKGALFGEGALGDAAADKDGPGSPKDTQKKGGKDKGKNYDDAKTSRVGSLETQGQQLRVQAADIAQKGLCTNLPPAAAQVLCALTRDVLLREVIPGEEHKISEESFTELLTAFASGEPSHSTMTPIRLTAMKEVLDATPDDQFQEYSVTLDALVKWMKLLVEHREGLFQSIKAEVTDMRIVDKEIEGMPIKSSVSAVAVDVYNTEIKGEGLEVLKVAGGEMAFPAPKVAPANPMATLVLPASVAEMLNIDESMMLLNWVKGGTVHLLVHEEATPDGHDAPDTPHGIEFLTRMFSGSTHVDIAPVEPRSDAVHDTAYCPCLRENIAFMYDIPVNDTIGTEVNPIGPAGPQVGDSIVRRMSPGVAVPGSTVTSLVGVAGDTLPPGSLPILETTFAHAALVPRGHGRVIFSSMPEDLDADFVNALLRRYTPESWSVEMASLLAFAPGTGGYGEPVVAEGIAQPRSVFMGPAVPRENERVVAANLAPLALVDGIDENHQPGLYNMLSGHWAWITRDEAAGVFLNDAPVLNPAAVGGHATVVEAEAVPAFWAAALPFKSDTTLVECLACEPPPLSTAETFEAGKKHMPDPEKGWTVSFWILPTRKTERSDQVLAYIDDGVAPCEVTITPAERVRLSSGADLKDELLAALKSEGGFNVRETEEYLRARSGTSQDALRFGDWNHIVVVQRGFTRDLFINGVLADATHYGGRPAAEGQYAQALFPDDTAAKGIACRPVHAVRIGGVQGEAVAFRGWCGPVSVWHRKMDPPQVASMYWNNLASNIFHPHRDLQAYAVDAMTVDTTASVWLVPRDGSNAVLKTMPDAIRSFVENGGSLFVPVEDADTVADLNAVFGWNLRLQDAPRATVIPDPNKPFKKEQQVLPARPASVRDLAHILPNVTKSPSIFDIPLVVDAASLPPKAVELYTSSIVYAFSTTVGEGRLSYMGYQGHGQQSTTPEDQNAWKTILFRLMRGQSKQDL